MKCDVVICYYRTEPLWPFVAWGLAQNQDHIGTIIVSNDEEWTQQAKDAIRIGAEAQNLNTPIKLLEHPRNGMRQSQCINDGVKAATEDYVLQIDDDIVLAPKCVSTFLSVAEPHNLLTGQLHDIARDGLTLKMFPDPIILRRDRRNIAAQSPYDVWCCVRDSFLFYHKDDYLAIGGHDEAYQDGQEEGYGFLDYDFAMRWFMRFGIDSFEMTPAEGYHMSGMKPGHDFSLANQARFNAQLGKYTEWLMAQGVA